MISSLRKNEILVVQFLVRSHEESRGRVTMPLQKKKKLSKIENDYLFDTFFKFNVGFIFMH